MSTPQGADSGDNQPQATSQQPPSAQPPAGGETPPEPDWKTRAEKAEADAEKWKQHYRTWEQRAKENQDKAKRWDEQEAANASDLDKEKQRAERAEADARKARERAAGAEVRALAADEWHDPADAPLYLGELSGYLSDSGDVDTERIKTDLAAVLEAKPHLKRGEQAPRTPKPDPGQGARPSEPEPIEQRVQSRLERIKADTGIS